MPVDQLLHVNIRCADVDRSRDFYVHHLGLRQGNRPPFASVGYWLYLGDTPVLHLVQQAGGTGSEPAGGGAVDHIAFRGVGLAATRTRLRGASVSFQEAVVPRDGSIQLFIFDPDGLKIELNFAADG